MKDYTPEDLAAIQAVVDAPLNGSPSVVCRIFRCRLCGRFLGGCTEHKAITELIDSCAVCSRKPSD